MSPFIWGIIFFEENCWEYLINIFSSHALSIYYGSSQEILGAKKKRPLVALIIPLINFNLIILLLKANHQHLFLFFRYLLRLLLRGLLALLPTLRPRKAVPLQT